LHPDNEDLPFPVVFTGPKESAAYFEQIDEFIGLTLGEQARSRYQVVVGDQVEVARIMKKGMEDVRRYRINKNDAFYFNWLLKIDPTFQIPFEPDHESMLSLKLHRDQPIHLLAANLRRMFSGIVAGNVKPQGLQAIREKGPFGIRAEAEFARPLDQLLANFVADNRMKIPGDRVYEPCYRLVD
jgi:hypothetical protein